MENAPAFRIGSEVFCRMGLGAVSNFRFADGVGWEYFVSGPGIKEWFPESSLLLPENAPVPFFDVGDKVVTASGLPGEVLQRRGCLTFQYVVKTPVYTGWYKEKNLRPIANAIKSVNIGDHVSIIDGREGEVVRVVVGKRNGLRYVVKGSGFEAAVYSDQIKYFLKEEEFEDDYENETGTNYPSEWIDGCSKKGFVSASAANARIREVRRTSSRSRIPIRAYLCPDCGTYHLTSKPKHK